MDVWNISFLLEWHFSRGYARFREGKYNQLCNCNDVVLWAKASGHLMKNGTLRWTHMHPIHFSWKQQNDVKNWDWNSLTLIFGYFWPYQCPPKLPYRCPPKQAPLRVSLGAWSADPDNFLRNKKTCRNERPDPTRRLRLEMEHLMGFFLQNLRK